MTKLVVIVGFCVAFAAGLTVGMSRVRPVASENLPPATMPTSRPSHHGPFLSELNVTPQQREKLDKIWQFAHSGRSEQDKQRQALRERRDATITSLIPAENREKYDKAISDYHEGLTEMDRTMRERVKNAIEDTKQILTPEQRAKYEEILSRHPIGAPGGPGGPPFGRGRGDSRGDHDSTTRRSEPATKPTHAQ
jgi:Spy/CpxP family protein refolding chaperone